MQNESEVLIYVGSIEFDGNAMLWISVSRSGS